MIPIDTVGQTMSNRVGTRLGEILLTTGRIDETGLARALERQARLGERLGEAVVALGLMTEDELIATLAEQLKAPVVDPSTVTIPAVLTNLVPALFARRRGCLPVARENGKVIVAMADPLDIATLDELAPLLGGRIVPALASRSSLQTALERHYPPTPTVAREDAPPYGSGEDGAAEGLAHLLRQGMNMGASDIHFEPAGGMLAVRYRVDGIMRPALSMSADKGQGVLSRLKVLAGIDIAESRLPQDGGASGDGAGLPGYELRVATFPTVNGESVVVRLLSTGPDLRSLIDLGMAPDTLAAYRSALETGWGMVIVTGPTGAGKTTTLYATLASMAGPTRTAVTVEDPVERRLPYVRQAQVNRRSGFTFPVGVKHALRQDPDILMVGEIRDAETASAAVQAALTGHLTLTSLHTGDAAGAIDRLIDLGVEPYRIGATFRGALAQRLVRALCVDCRGAGCPRCHGAGYRGRIGLFEFLPADDELRQMIRDGAPSSRIREKASGLPGYVNLADDGRRKIEAGITDEAEVVRGLHGI